MNYLLTPYSQNCYIFKGSLGTFISGDKEVAYIGYWTSPTFSSYLFVLTECLSAVLAFVYVLQYILCFCVSLAILSALIRGCCDFNLFIFGLVAAWWMCFHVPNLWMSADLLMSDPVIVKHEWNCWRKSFTTSTTSVLVWTNARSVSSVLSRAGGVKRNVNGCDLVRFPLTQAFIQRENGRKKHRLSKSCSCINLYIQKDTFPKYNDELTLPWPHRCHTACCWHHPVLQSVVWKTWEICANEQQSKQATQRCLCRGEQSEPQTAPAYKNWCSWLTKILTDSLSMTRHVTSPTAVALAVRTSSLQKRQRRETWVCELLLGWFLHIHTKDFQESIIFIMRD